MSAIVRPPVVSSFVFQPGGTPTPNTFTTWADLIAAIAALENINSYKYIVCDPSFGTPTVPAGAWDFGGFTTISGTSLDIDDGATFVTPPWRIEGVTLTSNSTAPVWVYDGTEPAPFLLMELATLSCTANPMIQVTNFAQIIHDSFTTITNSGGSEVYDIVNPAQCFLVMFTGSSIEGNTVQSDAGATVIAFYPNGQATGAGEGFVTTQTNMTDPAIISGDLPLMVGGRTYLVDSDFGDDARAALAAFPFATIEACITAINAAGAGQFKIYLAPGNHEVAAPITLPDGSVWVGVARNMVQIERTGNPGAGESVITMGQNCTLINLAISITSTATDSFAALEMPYTAGGADNQLQQVSITADNQGAGGAGSSDVTAVLVTSTTSGGDDNVQMEDCRMFVRTSNAGTKRAMYLSGAGGKIVAKNGFWFVNVPGGATGSCIETAGAGSTVHAYQGSLTGSGAGTIAAYTQGVGTTIQFIGTQDTLTGSGVNRWENTAMAVPSSALGSAGFYVGGTVLSNAATGSQGWNATALNVVLGNGTVADADSYHTHSSLTPGGTLSISGTSGEALAVGAPVCFANGGGTPAVLNADANNTARFNVVGFNQTLAGAGGVTVSIAIAGEVSIVDAIFDTAPVAADIGALVYLSENVGKITLTAPTTAGSYVLKVGTVTQQSSGGSSKVNIQIGEGVIL